MIKIFLTHLIIILAYLTTINEAVGHTFQNSEYTSNLFPKDFIEAFSLYKNKINTAGHFHQQSIINQEIWPFVKEIIEKTSSLDLHDSQFPNLTQPCLSNVLEFMNAFTAKTIWAIKSA